MLCLYEFSFFLALLVKLDRKKIEKLFYAKIIPRASVEKKERESEVVEEEKLHYFHNNNKRVINKG
jgi:hypothetical protein